MEKVQCNATPNRHLLIDKLIHLVGFFLSLFLYIQCMCSELTEVCLIPKRNNEMFAWVSFVRVFSIVSLISAKQQKRRRIEWLIVLFK